MNPKRILIVNTQSILIGAAENILKNCGNFAVINTYSRDLGTLDRQIELERPDVIVMDEDTYFIEPLRLFVSFRNIPNIRLLILNNRRSLVNVYEKRERVISHPSQLIDAIDLDENIFNPK